MADSKEDQPAGPVQATVVKQHDDGDGKYGQCNISENHALRFPGHSVTVIQNMKTEQGKTFTVLIIACMGTPAVFMADGDERDCTFYEEIRLP